jgi:hypothetical protein
VRPRRAHSRFYFGIRVELLNRGDDSFGVPALAGLVNVARQSFLPKKARSGAGENFLRWLKTRKPASGNPWSKKLTAQNTIENTGVFRVRIPGRAGWHRRC